MLRSIFKVRDSTIFICALLKLYTERLSGINASSDDEDALLKDMIGTLIEHLE